MPATMELQTFVPAPGVVLLLGAPGAGKGTQARLLAERLKVPHVASGDLLRDHRRRGTWLGQAAQAFMDRGDLVPDDLVVQMVMGRLDETDARDGVLLDGFPRTATQADALDAALSARGAAVQRAIYLELDTRVLIERLSGRWTCPGCQATYHATFNPSPSGSSCAVCGKELSQRPDDRRKVVENRVNVYLRDTMPVVEHYAARGVLSRVNAAGDIAEVRDALFAVLEETAELAPA